MNIIAELHYVSRLLESKKTSVDTIRDIVKKLNVLKVAEQIASKYKEIYEVEDVSVERDGKVVITMYTNSGKNTRPEEPEMDDWDDWNYTEMHKLENKFIQQLSKALKINLKLQHGNDVSDTRWAMAFILDPNYVKNEMEKEAIEEKRIREEKKKENEKKKEEKERKDNIDKNKVLSDLKSIDSDVALPSKIGALFLPFFSKNTNIEKIIIDNFRSFSREYKTEDVSELHDRMLKDALSVKKTWDSNLNKFSQVFSDWMAVTTPVSVSKRYTPSAVKSMIQSGKSDFHADRNNPFGVRMKIYSIINYMKFYADCDKFVKALEKISILKIENAIA
jgi:hypothetical protein